MYYIILYILIYIIYIIYIYRHTHTHIYIPFSAMEYVYIYIILYMYIYISYTYNIIYVYIYMYMSRSRLILLCYKTQARQLAGVIAGPDDLDKLVEYSDEDMQRQIDDDVRELEEKMADVDVPQLQLALKAYIINIKYIKSSPMPLSPE